MLFPFTFSCYLLQSMGPILIFSSEDDDLAPYQVIFNFSLRLKELGVDARLVKWSNSPHVGESWPDFHCFEFNMMKSR